MSSDFTLRHIEGESRARTSAYMASADGVVFKHHYVGTQRLEHADPASFMPIADSTLADFEPPYFAGKDEESVWFMHKKVPGADPQSFEYFHGGQCKWGRDRAHLYCFYVDRIPKIKVMKSKCLEAFGFFHEHGDFLGPYMRQYAHDAHYVYYYGRRVRGARPQTFCRLRKDGLSKGFTLSDYYAGERAVYYRGRELLGADPTCARVFYLPVCSQEYVFDRSAFFVRGRRLTDFLAEHDKCIAAYVKARPELADEYWSQIPALRVKWT
jgi:DKNYY family